VAREIGIGIEAQLDVMRGATMTRDHHEEKGISSMIDVEVEHGEGIAQIVMPSTLDQGETGRKALRLHQRRRSPPQT